MTTQLCPNVVLQHFQGFTNIKFSQVIFLKNENLNHLLLALLVYLFKPKGGF